MRVGLLRDVVLGALSSPKRAHDDDGESENSHQRRERERCGEQMYSRAGERGGEGGKQKGSGATERRCTAGELDDGFERGESRRSSRDVGGGGGPTK